MSTLNHYDVIIVGSGFGGSVCAARLAEKGMRVLVLERGPWWGPLQKDRPAPDRRDLPRGLLGSRKLLRNLRFARGRRRSEWLLHADGLLETHMFDHLNTFTASAVGGGSHIWTNILEKPSDDHFTAYPDEITGEEMHLYFDRVRAILRPAPVPVVPPKSQVFAESAEAAGLPAAQYPELAVAWGEHPDHPQKITNAAGVEQSTSTYRGDVFVGCEDGSKTTLDLTYIPLALRYGAELRPLCEARAVGVEKGKYWVHYRDHRSRTETRVSAPRLVLAAGGLNTQRLLFAARDGHGALPKLPATLGQCFSTNADLAMLLWKTARLRDSSYGPSVGACTYVTDRSRPDGSHRFVIGEMGMPARALPLPGFLRRWLERSTFLFGMGRDAPAGKLAFDGQGLTTTLGRSSDPHLYAEMDEALARLMPYYEPKGKIANFLAGAGREGIFSVHPLGGCSIGAGPNEGFTSHRGEVFGHPGLYIADGSLYPRSPGIAPSMTIAALAERMAALME